jgi:hypothetical protein
LEVFTENEEFEFLDNQRQFGHVEYRYSPSRVRMADDLNLIEKNWATAVPWSQMGYFAAGRI